MSQFRVVLILTLTLTVTHLGGCDFDPSGVDNGDDTDAAQDTDGMAAADARPDGTPQPDGSTPPTPDAAPMTPDAAPMTPDAAPMTPDAAPMTPDAAPMTPDAAPMTPDAAPMTPDAAPMTPDAAVPVSVCGDGSVNPATEECDDANTTSGDGCSAGCTWEASACGPGASLSPLAIGVTVSGSTSGGVNNLQSNGCGGSGPEDAYTVTVDALSDMTVTTDLPGTTYNSVIYVRTDCDNIMTELGCQGGGFGSTGDTLPLTNVPPGTYFVVVDGFNGASGAYQLRVDLLPIVPTGGVCDPTGVSNRCADGSTCLGGVCVSDTIACESSAMALPLDSGVTTAGTTMGATGYEPSCAGGAPTGPEDIWTLTVPPGGPYDLLLEVAGAGTLNPVIDLTASCGVPSSSLDCTNSSSTARQEIVVAPAVSGGTYYGVVDGVNSTAGSYSATAWLRTLAGPGGLCSLDLVGYRCTSGYCVDTDGDGMANCTALTPVDDVGSNFDPCTTVDGPFHNDFAYEATMTSGGDLDVILLEPMVDTEIVVVIYGPNGGCDVDLRVDLLDGMCSSPGVVAGSDDEGLGACPYLDTNGVMGATLQGGSSYWLSVSRAATFGTGAYTLVVDFQPL